MQVIQELDKRTGVRIQPTALVSQSLGQVAAFYERHAKRRSERAALRIGPKREDKWGSWNQRLSRGVQRLLRIEGSHAS
jgi:hypothetical protein